VERHEIEAFLAVAEELHFGRAAARLRISTARVSQIVRGLERQVGVALFERTSRRVSLTAVGRRLFDDLQPAYAAVQAAIAQAVTDGRGVAGRLRVGFVGAAAGRLLVQAAQRFRRRHPGSEVSLHEVQVGGALDQVLSGAVDLLAGCLPLGGPGLTAGPVLLSEPRLFAVAAGHPLARRAAVSVADLAGRPMISAPCGPPDASGPVAETFQEVLALVGAGDGGFVVGEHVRRYYPRPDVAYVPIRDAPPLLWGTVWRTAASTARVRAFAAEAPQTQEI
jgi:DNA-binding transcriptional LysR family regulator